MSDDGPSRMKDVTGKPTARGGGKAGAGLAGSLELVERWAEHVASQVSPVTLMRYRKVLVALARRLGERSLAEATMVDVDGWLATAAPTTRTNYASPLASFYRWAAAQQIVADDPSRGLCHRDGVPRSSPPPPATPTGPLPVVATVGYPDGLAGMLKRWAEADDVGVDPEEAPRRSKQMKTRAAIGIYLRYKQDAGIVSPRTSSTMRGVLYAFAEHCPPDAARITQRDVVRWLRTTTHLAASTRRNVFTTARGFTGWLQRRGTLHRDPFVDLPRPKAPRAVPRSVATPQVRALLASCVEPRETVIVVLGVHTGLRCAELAGLEVGDVDLSGRTVFVRRGKGGGSRVVPLSVEACQVVGRYVAELGLSGGPLLRSLSFPQQGIRPGTLGGIFRALGYRAGVKVRAGDGVGCHSLRHTFATDTYEATNDVLAVRDLLGHESLATTQIYVRSMNVERLRAAVEGRSYLPAQPDAAARGVGGGPTYPAVDGRAEEAR